MRALVLHHPYTYPRFERDFVARIAELSEFDVAPADLDALDAGELVDSGRSVALANYDAVVVFVAFKRLRAAPTLSWAGFRGLRVLMDHDIIQNYSDIFDPTLKGAWPPIFHRHRFDAVITSGGAVQARLADEGIAADWVPKAFEPALFAEMSDARAGVVTYGSAYSCRLIAESALTDARLPLVRLPMTPYVRLGAELNRFLGCMAISSDLDAPVEQRAALIGAPARDVSMRPGLEPMAKLFESAGAGCCPIADAMEDLPGLGFRDGENVLSFSSHAELVDKVQAALDMPDHLRSMGAAAAALARERHTWAHRARAMSEALLRRI